MDKSQVRAEARGRRRDIPHRREKVQSVLEQLKAHPAVQGAHHIASYVSFGTELDTDAINGWILEGKSLYLPRVEGEHIQFYHVTDLHNQLVEGSYHIREPLPTLPKMDRADVVLVPGLAFTKDGCRMGYGGGYYDKFLEHSTTTKIGICFQQQIMPTLPVHTLDVKMDEIITDI